MSRKQFDRWLLNQGASRKNGRYYIPCDGSARKGESDGSLVVTISSRSRDRHGDVLEPHGADTSAFDRNPVVLWAHKYDELPIGRATRVWSDGQSMSAEIVFDSRPFAQEVLRLYREGFLAGWSVGFLPKKWEVMEDEDGKFNGYHVTEWELIELSAVPVPANPEALVRELETGGVRVPALLKDLGDALDAEEDVPEISAEALERALFPLMRKWAEQAAAQEIRRRQGRIE